jgi:4'-phosphopantetheinyl transferase
LAVSNGEKSFDELTTARDAPADEVRVWRIPLRHGDATVERLFATLSVDERARARRLRRPAQDRFIVAHGAMRDIIGRGIGLAPDAVAFHFGPHGKPSLAPNAADLRFNLSHSADLALLAVACGREVGVDLERIRETADITRLARRFFSAEACAELQCFPPEARRRAFFAHWTRVEAFVKARGEGLFSSPRPLADRATPDAAWTICIPDVPEAYCAALVVSGGPARVTHFSWSPPKR